MFRAPAHSFTQQARLAISLSWIGGYTNALTVLACSQVTSHLTGTLSQAAVEVAHARWSAAAYLGGLLGMFLFGAFLAGVLTETGRLRRWQSIYVLPIAVEALLLAGFALAIDWQATGDLGGASAQLWLTFLPAVAMGLQNATITRISGGVVRTTHMTGVVTDLGLELARFGFRAVGLRSRLPERRANQEHWRLWLLLSIPGSFALGVLLATLAFDAFRALSMVPAVAFLGFLILQDVLVPIAAVTLRPGVARGAAAAVAVFHADPPEGADRPRLPDLTAWALDLAAAVRVVVLDLAALPSLGERSAFELRALRRQLQQDGRRLVLTGLRSEHLAALQHLGAIAEFDPDDLCADLAAAQRRAEALTRAP
ncbi:MAG: DUF1275 family protein [Planctomycetota bacterium]